MILYVCVWMGTNDEDDDGNEKEVETQTKHQKHIIISPMLQWAVLFCFVVVIVVVVIIIIFSFSICIFSMSCWEMNIFTNIIVAVIYRKWGRRRKKKQKTFAIDYEFQDVLLRLSFFLFFFRCLFVCLLVYLFVKKKTNKHTRPAKAQYSLDKITTTTTRKNTSKETESI